MGVVSVERQIRENSAKVSAYLADLSNWEASEASQSSGRGLQKKFRKKNNIKKATIIRETNGSVVSSENTYHSSDTQNKPYKRDGNKLVDYYKAWDAFDEDVDHNVVGGENVGKNEETRNFAKNPNFNNKNPNIPINNQGTKQTAVKSKITNKKNIQEIQNITAENNHHKYLQAQNLKLQGNSYIARFQYKEAIEIYTRAINLIITKINSNSLPPLFPPQSSPLNLSPPNSSSPPSLSPPNLSSVPTLSPPCQTVPVEAILYSNLGYARMKVGEFLEAIKSCEEALRFDNRYQKPWYYRGLSLAQRGNIREARNSFQNACLCDGSLVAKAQAEISLLDCALERDEREKIEKNKNLNRAKMAKNVQKAHKIKIYREFKPFRIHHIPNPQFPQQENLESQVYKTAATIDKNISEKIENNICERIENNISEKMENNISEKMANNISEKIENNISEKIENKISEKIENNICEKIQNNISEKIESNISEKMQNDTSENTSSQISHLPSLLLSLINDEKKWQKKQGGDPNIINFFQLSQIWAAYGHTGTRRRRSGRRGAPFMASRRDYAGENRCKMNEKVSKMEENRSEKDWKMDKNTCEKDFKININTCGKDWKIDKNTCEKHWKIGETAVEMGDKGFSSEVDEPGNKYRDRWNLLENITEGQNLGSIFNSSCLSVDLSVEMVKLIVYRIEHLHGLYQTVLEYLTGGSYGKICRETGAEIICCEDINKQKEAQTDKPAFLAELQQGISQIAASLFAASKIGLQILTALHQSTRFETLTFFFSTAEFNVFHILLKYVHNLSTQEMCVQKMSAQKKSAQKNGAEEKGAEEKVRGPCMQGPHKLDYYRIDIYAEMSEMEEDDELSDGVQSAEKNRKNTENFDSKNGKYQQIEECPKTTEPIDSKYNTQFWPLENIYVKFGSDKGHDHMIGRALNRNPISLQTNQKFDTYIRRLFNRHLLSKP